MKEQLIRKGLRDEDSSRPQPYLLRIRDLLTRKNSYELLM